MKKAYEIIDWSLSEKMSFILFPNGVCFHPVETNGLNLSLTHSREISANGFWAKSPLCDFSSIKVRQSKDSKFQR